MRLHRRERGEPVAIDRGALEIERGGGLFHFRGKLVLHRLALARQKALASRTSSEYSANSISRVQGRSNA